MEDRDIRDAFFHAAPYLRLMKFFQLLGMNDESSYVGCIARNVEVFTVFTRRLKTTIIGG